MCSLNHNQKSMEEEKKNIRALNVNENMENIF